MLGKAKTKKLRVFCQYCSKSFFAFSKLKKMTCFDCYMELKRKRAKTWYERKKKEKDARGKNKK